MSQEPARTPIAADWTHHALWDRVRTALFAVPARFQSNVDISGVPATDLFNLNAILGAAIEDRVVDTLNDMRSVWDPDDDYASYAFARQAQTFPDVLCCNLADRSDVLFGIELKGWYILAKEGEPSFRFSVTPAVCAPADLLAVFPWHLSEVISGTPRLLAPYVEHARYVAEFRNHHWAELMVRKTGVSGLTLSTSTQPYPVKSDEIVDVAENDRGGNFGRIARTNLLEGFCRDVLARRLAGIPASSWRKFLVAFKDAAYDAEINEALHKLTARIHEEQRANDENVMDLLAKFEAIVRLFRSGGADGG